MQTYQWVVVLLKFIVDFLLLLGGGRLSGELAGLGRCVLGAAVGAIHSSMCLIWGMHFLGNPLWRGIGIILMVLTAYGLQRSTVRRGAVFAILSLAFGGISMGLGGLGIFSLFAAAMGVGLLCVLGFRKNGFGGKYVPVEICSGDIRLQLKALLDTGNTLRDPITGRPVLIINADAAHRLTGLSAEQLRSPVESIGAISGLRLIPYRSVGTENGFMLARKYQNVSIGKWKGSSLIAFAPEGLSGDIEALTGGIT